MSYVIKTNVVLMKLPLRDSVVTAQWLYEEGPGFSYYFIFKKEE